MRQRSDGGLVSKARRAPLKLSPKQREVLMRASTGEDRQIPERLHHEPGRLPFVVPARRWYVPTGEDRQIPERLHHEPGRLPFVVPARRWYVPPGFLVPEGSAEYAAARVLAAKGLLKHDRAPQSPELPYGLGGYSITSKGRKALP